MVRLTDCLDMIIVVDWDAKPQIKQTKKKLSVLQHRFDVIGCVEA